MHVFSYFCYVLFSSNVISFDPELDENIVESKQNGHVSLLDIQYFMKYVRSLFFLFKLNVCNCNIT